MKPKNITEILEEFETWAEYAEMNQVQRNNAKAFIRQSLQDLLNGLKGEEIEVPDKLKETIIGQRTMAGNEIVRNHNELIESTKK